MEIPAGWSLKDNTIEKEFTFKNFKEALDFVNKVGELAESVNHHPDIFLHNWRNVTLSLTTHNAGHLTEKDTILAEKVNVLNP